MESFKAPVVFLIFNRPNTTKVVFDAIAAAKPNRLLVIADGPRPHIADEAELCMRARAVVQLVDWPCDVQLNYSDVNLGCRERVISGLHWAFSLVEEAIILEDDCVPDPSFFPFCQTLLTRFREDRRVGMIAGTNFVEDKVNTPYSYYFSQLVHIWGWATWRRAWLLYDRDLKDWPQLRQTTFLEELFHNPEVSEHWAHLLDRMHDGTGPNTWDIQWAYTCFIHNALAIVPRRNLVRNIGFGSNATHTLVADPRHKFVCGAMEFPLRHPPSVYPSHSIDRLDARLGLPPSLAQRAIWKVRRILSRSIRRSN